MARRGRYSNYIRPISFIVDISVLIVFAFQFQFDLEINIIFFSYLTVTWIFLSLNTNFYEVYRFTKFVKITSLTIYQAVLFTLIVFGFFGYFYQFGREPSRIFLYLGKSFLVIFLIKNSLHIFLKKYRKDLGRNFRRTIIIGSTQKSYKLKSFFDNKPEYGYKCQKLFKIRSNSNIEEIYKFILDEKIDEIYCSIAELNNEQLNSVISFADNNLKVLKFLPDNKDIYSKKLNYEYYGYLPIISLRKIPIDLPVNKFLKRSFDIVLSIIVIIFILSWLTPILSFFIIMESKGTVFFKQKRSGLYNEEFYCYKFRSMKLNLEADLNQANRHDKRVTKIGRFIRKTSIDELPQFFNVLIGDMSVIGPRPHMVSYTNIFAESIDRFMVRHFIKPGITGLAQINGYRGEVKSEKDIINRVKYDIFYLENWSLLLDMKIVFQTVIKAIKGDKMAY